MSNQSPSVSLPVNASGMVSLADSVSVIGRANAPAAGAPVVTLVAGLLGAGTYRVSVYALISGAVAVGDLDNLRLRRGAATIGSAIAGVGGLLGTVPGTPVRVCYDQITLADGDALSVNANAAATALSVYTVLLIATKVI